MFPFVGYQRHGTGLCPNPEEVAAVLEVPLAALLDVRNRRVEYWDVPDFVGGRRIPCFRFTGWLVWGATAMILNEMASLLETAVVQCLPEARGHASGVAGVVA